MGFVYCAVATKSPWNVLLHQFPKPPCIRCTVILEVFFPGHECNKTTVGQFPLNKLIGEFNHLCLHNGENRGRMPSVHVDQGRGSLMSWPRQPYHAFLK